jgi:3-hydroxyisobutyrate dehydrogenase-like beta-hydroxyacid dehydrogenase
MANKSTQLGIAEKSVHEEMPFSRPPTTHSQPLRIGFYGLENMGYLMARNLATRMPAHPAVPPPLLVYNRTVSKCEKLSKEVRGEDKVRIAHGAAQLAFECDIIVTNLSDDDVVKNVYAEFSEALTVRSTRLAVRILLKSN